MELLSFGLMVAVPLAFLCWAMTKRGYLSLFAAPFIVMLFYAVVLLNFDPTLAVPQKDIACNPVRTNSTVSGSLTTYGSEGCRHYETKVTHTIAPDALTVINYTMFIGVAVVIGIIFIRVSNKFKERAQTVED